MIPPEGTQGREREEELDPTLVRFQGLFDSTNGLGSGGAIGDRSSGQRSAEMNGSFWAWTISMLKVKLTLDSFWMLKLQCECVY